MSQGVSQRSHTAVARIKSQASAYEICGGWSATGIGYSPSTSIFPFSIIPPILHNHLHIRVASKKKKKRKKTVGRRDLQKAFFFSPVNGRHWIEKYFQLANFRANAYAVPRTSRCVVHWTLPGNGIGIYFIYGPVFISVGIQWREL